ncbi:hypothetical protein CN378_10205 [Bacillus sp. AFS015802]|uniref:flagellar hook-length control protein FliK n=1 Tax=Bacillus sp. AFS015802 TaxID=2033486 RepID=UPI000BF7F936|nr:flagellar hook-length control protein FliK [Bacillus sp. AFS015802]PFA67880.1 hypothetical protein CN378_10205 [Bacillus sp. AFS015802]
MEIGIGTPQASTLTSMSKGTALHKKGMEGFSRQLLGFVSNQVSGKEEIKEQDGALSLLANLQAILAADEMEELGLSQAQIDELSKVKELDIEQIADVIGVNTGEIQTLFSDMKSVLLGTLASPASSKDVYDNLLGALQLLQSALTQDVKGLKSVIENALQGMNTQGRIEDALKLSKVMELFARNRDMHVTDASKASELKEMVKNIQTGIEGSVSKMGQPPGGWSRVLREAYTRRLPDETLEKNPKADASTLDKKHILSNQGTNFPFVLSKTDTFSMSLTSTSRSVQYEQFVKEFQNILSKSNMMVQPNMSKLLIKLYPEQLGSLRIELLQQNGVMTAKILASTASAKDMLDSHIQGLKHAFSSQNLHVEKIEISQALADTERPFKGQSQQQSSQQQKQQHSDQPDSNQEEGNQSFKDYLVNTEI